MMVRMEDRVVEMRRAVVRKDFPLLVEVRKTLPLLVEVRKNFTTSFWGEKNFTTRKVSPSSSCQ